MWVRIRIWLYIMWILCLYWHEVRVRVVNTIPHDMWLSIRLRGRSDVKCKGRGLRVLPWACSSAPPFDPGLKWNSPHLPAFGAKIFYFYVDRGEIFFWRSFFMCSWSCQLIPFLLSSASGFLCSYFSFLFFFKLSYLWRKQIIWLAWMRMKEISRKLLIYFSQL